MKNLFASFIIIIASISLFSCTKETQSIISETNEDFTGVLISDDTRTSLGDDGSTVWSDRDEVSIFKKNGYHQKYRVKRGGNTSAVLSYVPGSSKKGAALDHNYAVYPYSANHAIAQEVFNLDLSFLAEQTYTEGSFENNKSVMVAKSDDTNLGFFNALSLLRVKLCSEVPGDYSIKSITITSATQPLNGTATLDMSVSKQPAVFTSTAAENKSTTLVCSEAVMLTDENCNDTEGGHDFYILMPAATFSAKDLTIKIIGEDVNGEDVVYETQYPAELVLTRSGITTIHHKFVADDWQGYIEPVVTVSTAQDLLAAFEDAENISTIELAGDIDLQDIDWTPVGTNDAPFSANIDGKGFSIKNLTISDPSLAAFIAYTGENVTIKNLTLENVNISSDKYAAGVVGENNYDDLVIENVKVSGTINAKSYAGGIIFMAGGVEIKNCVNEANITAGFAGGIVGYAYYGTEISDVENTGNITGSAGAGGIAFDFSGTIRNAVNNGTITSNGTAAAGGIACRQNAASKYEYCYNYGDVISIKDDPNASAAGILGLSGGTATTLNYCANYGDITAEQSYAAGIAYSLYGTITANYCYNEGAINGADGAGGIAPKAQFGTTDKALYCLNAGAVTSSGGSTYQASNNNTSCFYYNNGELLSVGNNTAIANDAALSKLNSGTDSSFFVVDGGKIVVNK